MGRSTYRLYDVLGVSRGVDFDALRKAWRAKARALHPDRNPDDPDAAARFAEASRAWEVLSDDRKRTLYERFGDHAVDMDFHPSLDAVAAEPRRSAGSGARSRPAAGRPRRRRAAPDDPTAFPGAWSGSGETADEPWHGHGARMRTPKRDDPNPQPRRRATPGEPPPPSQRTRTRPPPPPPKRRRRMPTRGADVQLEVVVPLKTAAIGGTWPVQYERPALCDKCDGEGKRPSGRMCSACRGTGRVTVAATADVVVPPDTRNNRHVVVRGAGGMGIDNGPDGDLRATIKVAPHPTLVRKGLDLWTEATLTPAEAAAGGTIDVRNLEKLVAVEVPANAADGKTIRVRGAGVPGPRGRLPGDLHVRIRVSRA